MPVRFDPILGDLVFDKLPFDLTLRGICASDMAASKTIVNCPNLSGYGDDYFNDNYYMMVFKNDNSEGNAPVGDYPRKVTDSTNAGVFTVEAFSENVEADDEVYLINKTILAAIRTTKLAITGSIAAATNFSVTSSGTSYTKSGDDGALQASATLFNLNEAVAIYLNGVYQDKGVHATWVSAASFKLDVAVDNGDEIIILSQ